MEIFFSITVSFPHVTRVLIKYFELYPNWSDGDLFPDGSSEFIVNLSWVIMASRAVGTKNSINNSL